MINYQLNQSNKRLRKGKEGDVLTLFAPYVPTSKKNIRINLVISLFIAILLLLLFQTEFFTYPLSVSTPFFSSNTNATLYSFSFLLGNFLASVIISFCIFRIIEKIQTGKIISPLPFRLKVGDDVPKYVILYFAAIILILICQAYEYVSYPHPSYFLIV